MRPFICAALLVLPGIVAAQVPPDEQPRPFEAPASPSATLDEARAAFRNGDYAALRRLLEPMLVPSPVFDDADERIEARQLLGVGLFFDAQQVTDAQDRRAFLDVARQNYLDLLLERPDFVLDPLLYPASVVEMFEAVRSEHAEELQKILDDRNGGATQDPATQTIYVERNVSRRNFALVFFPFGIGQFQNGDAVKGTLFAVGQVLSIGLNLTSYAMVESLRGADGFYDPGVDRRGGDYQDALTWRNVMYGSLGAFVALWVGSVVDGAFYFEDMDVRIRALDAPPPELMPDRPAGPQSLLPLGWSLQVSF